MWVWVTIIKPTPNPHLWARSCGFGFYFGFHLFLICVCICIYNHVTMTNNNHTQCSFPTNVLGIKGGKDAKKEGFVSNITNFQHDENKYKWIIFNLVQYTFSLIYTTAPFCMSTCLTGDNAWFWTLQNVTAPRTGHLSTTWTPTWMKGHLLVLGLRNNMVSLGVTVAVVTLRVLSTKVCFDSDDIETW